MPPLSIIANKGASAQEDCNLESFHVH